MLSDLIAKSVQTAVDSIFPSKKIITLSHPEVATHGDFSCSIALQLAKELKQSPLDIAKKIADSIDKGALIEKIEVLPPGFINIFIKSEVLLKEAASFANLRNTSVSNINAGKEAIVEYSSPNIAKPFTVGHLRSTIIGDAVANLLEATGYKVYRDNHLGDWGTQFGKQIYAIKYIKIIKNNNGYTFEHYGPYEEFTNDNVKIISELSRPVKLLVQLYVEFHKFAEEQPQLEELARGEFNKLESNDVENKTLWQKCIDWSFIEFDSIYKKLGVHFSQEFNNGRGLGESFFEEKMPFVISELKENYHSNFKKNNNAWLFYFENDKYPPLMIIKQDGSTLYSTRDLATDRYRKLNYPNVSLIINEVGAEQSLYFQQLYEIEKILGWYKDGQRVHLKHGLYRFKDMKMSSRKGNVIWLEDVLIKAYTAAYILSLQKGNFKDGWITDELLEENKLHPDKRDLRSEIVGIGALKWNDLKRSSHLDIVFDWNDILNMQGNSGPYMQYAYVRTLSILNKAEQTDNLQYDAESLNEDDITLLKQFYKYPEVVELAAKNYAPHILTTYLYELAQAFSAFYQKNRILKAESSERNNRLLITKATSNIIKQGLSLLGIQTVEKM